MPVGPQRHNDATVSLSPALQWFEDRRPYSPCVHAYRLLTLTKPMFVFITLVSLLAKLCYKINSPKS